MSPLPGRPHIALVVLVLALAGCGKSSKEEADEIIQNVGQGIGEGAEQETETFVNRKDSMQLSPFLKERFVPFAFAYPKTWTFKEGGGGKLARGSNFVKLSRLATHDVTGEDLAVGWIVAPSGVSGEAYAKQHIPGLQAQFAKGYPAYKHVGDEQTTLGGMPAIGWRFSSHVTAEQAGSTDFDLWGLVLLVPNVVENRGVVVIAQGSSRTGTLASAADIGVKGELPILLKSFRFGE